MEIITPKSSMDIVDLTKPILVSMESFQALTDMKVVCPKWLELDIANLCGKVVAKPTREDIDMNIRETLIVELYSK